jgi:hypothetical protein
MTAWPLEFFTHKKAMCYNTVKRSYGSAVLVRKIAIMKHKSSLQYSKSIPNVNHYKNAIASCDTVLLKENMKERGDLREHPSGQFSYFTESRLRKQIIIFPLSIPSNNTIQ